MQVKMFEIRDKGTFIPALGILCSSSDPAEAWLWRRAGYGGQQELFLLIDVRGGGCAEYNPYAWGDRTWFNAHRIVEENWETLESGAVLDVEFKLGETATPKVSERWGR